MPIESFLSTQSAILVSPFYLCFFFFFQAIFFRYFVFIILRHHLHLPSRWIISADFFESSALVGLSAHFIEQLLWSCEVSSTFKLSFFSSPHVLPLTCVQLSADDVHRMELLSACIFLTPQLTSMDVPSALENMQLNLHRRYKLV